MPPNPLAMELSALHQCGLQVAQRQQWGAWTRPGVQLAPTNPPRVAWSRSAPWPAVPLHMPGTHGGGQGLLVLLQGAEPRGDLQQRDGAQLGAAADEAPVVLQAQAEERLVADLGTEELTGWMLTPGLPGSRGSCRAARSRPSPYVSYGDKPWQWLCLRHQPCTPRAVWCPEMVVMGM